MYPNITLHLPSIFMHWKQQIHDGSCRIDPVWPYLTRSIFIQMCENKLLYWTCKHIIPSQLQNLTKTQNWGPVKRTGIYKRPGHGRQLKQTGISSTQVSPEEMIRHTTRLIARKTSPNLWKRIYGLIYKRWSICTSSPHETWNYHPLILTHVANHSLPSHTTGIFLAYIYLSGEERTKTHSILKHLGPLAATQLNHPETHWKPLQTASQAANNITQMTASTMLMTFTWRIHDDHLRSLDWLDLRLPSIYMHWKQQIHDNSCRIDPVWPYLTKSIFMLRTENKLLYWASEHIIPSQLQSLAKAQNWSPVRAGIYKGHGMGGNRNI
jgi:hypothetical protein